jgi:hypothetical protein
MLADLQSVAQRSSPSKAAVNQQLLGRLICEVLLGIFGFSVLSYSVPSSPATLTAPRPSHLELMASWYIARQCALLRRVGCVEPSRPASLFCSALHHTFT